ncbi:phosphomethylpyrimidine synthase ThiC, partial [Bacillus spizizenii]|nr:phosphomethylpyrimidine synthase ThiC [Bacillus spizizenii]
FSVSKKVYVEGSSSDIQVPMREFALSPSTGSFGEEENAPVRVYDTSGPYTDPVVTINIQEGLKPLRHIWITERNDVVESDGGAISPDGSG